MSMMMSYEEMYWPIVLLHHMFLYSCSKSVRVHHHHHGRCQNGLHVLDPQLMMESLRFYENFIFRRLCPPLTYIMEDFPSTPGDTWWEKLLLLRQKRDIFVRIFFRFNQRISEQSPEQSDTTKNAMNRRGFSQHIEIALSQHQHHPSELNTCSSTIYGSHPVALIFVVTKQQQLTASTRAAIQAPQFFIAGPTADTPGLLFQQQILIPVTENMSSSVVQQASALATG